MHTHWPQSSGDSSVCLVCICWNVNASHEEWMLPNRGDGCCGNGCCVAFCGHTYLSGSIDTNSELSFSFSFFFFSLQSPRVQRLFEIVHTPFWLTQDSLTTFYSSKGRSKWDSVWSKEKRFFFHQWWCWWDTCTKFHLCLHLNINRSQHLALKMCTVIAPDENTQTHIHHTCRMHRFTFGGSLDENHIMLFARS